MSKEKLSGSALTKHLREIMASYHDSRLNDDGDMVMFTKAEALAEILADRALGWDEELEIEDKKVPGKVTKVMKKHPPEKWAIVMVYERMEGKTPTALADETKGLTAAERVGELAVTAINDLTDRETEETEEIDDGSIS